MVDIDLQKIENIAPKDMAWVLEMPEITHSEYAIAAENLWIQCRRDTAAHLVTMMSVSNVHDHYDNSIISL